jgi:hypothetical protein
VRAGSDPGSGTSGEEEGNRPIQEQYFLPSLMFRRLAGRRMAGARRVLWGIFPLPEIPLNNCSNYMQILMIIDN